MKKIAAVAIAGALTAGVTAISQPAADAYGLKPTHCAILGGGHDATTFRTYKFYPVQVICRAPGAVPSGVVGVRVTGGGNAPYTAFLRLDGAGNAFLRAPIGRSGPIKMVLTYKGAPGLLGATALQYTQIIKL